MDIREALEHIETAIAKRAQKLTEAAGEDLNRLRGEIIDLLDLAQGVAQHPAVTGAATTTTTTTPEVTVTTPEAVAAGIVVGSMSTDAPQAAQEGASASESQGEVSSTAPAPEATPGA